MNAITIDRTFMKGGADVNAQPKLDQKALQRLTARPTGGKVDLRAFHSETMKRFPKIMKRLAE